MAIKYKWLAETLKTVIQKNIKLGIDKLPSENELCKKYHVSRQTVRQALALLEKEQLIIKKQGSGAFITGLSSNSRFNHIALLLPNDEYYTFPLLQNSIQNTLHQNGYQTTTFRTNNQIYKEREILTQLLANPPRGLIIWPVKSTLPNPNLDLYVQLKDKNCQLLFLQNAYSELRNELTLKKADYKGSLMLTQHLLSQNHKKIGGIFLSDSTSGHHRYLGFMNTMRDHNLPVMDKQICWITSEELQELRENRHPEVLKKYIYQNQSEVSDSVLGNTAYICYNAEIAYYLCKEIQYLSKASFDKLEIATFDYNYLTHFHQTKFRIMAREQEDIGTLSANMMIQKLKGLPVMSQEIPFQLITL